MNVSIPNHTCRPIHYTTCPIQRPRCLRPHTLSSLCLSPLFLFTGISLSLFFPLALGLGPESESETSHPLHTHIRSTSYIYKVFLYLLLWVWFIIIRSNPNLILLGLTVTEVHLVSVCGFLLLTLVIGNAVAMIAASNPLHTHTRSKSVTSHSTVSSGHIDATPT
jgi:hypothetical protein